MASRLTLRRKKVLELLGQVPISSTIQLAEATGVSTETMRKDLDALADDGMIIKVHGGVALANQQANEIPFDLRATKNVAEKRKIARAAIQLVQPHDSIILEGCTTNLELAKELAAKPDLLETLVVVTNSFSIATVFDGGRKCNQFFFLGGWVNPSQYACRGSQTVHALSGFHVNKAFLSGAALTSNYILAGFYDDDTAFQKTAIQSAKETVLMIGSSKFGQAAILSVAGLAEMDYLVTDKVFTPQEEQEISRLNVKIITAG